MLTRFLIRAVFAGLGLAFAAHFIHGIHYNNMTTLILAALLLGAVNAIVRPVLVILTLPLTIITLGLFLLVINALMIGLVSWLLKGFEVHGLVPAMLAAVITGVTSWVAHIVLGDIGKRP